MKAYCTICSYKKNEECREFPEKEFPAIELSKSERIMKVYELSLKDEVGFRILSGEHGLLEPETVIKCYDCRLVKSKVPILVDRVVTQLVNENVKEILFFGKDPADNRDWQPYVDCITLACEKAKVKLVKELIQSSLLSI